MASITVNFDFTGGCNVPVTNGYLIFDFGVAPTPTPPVWGVPAGVTPAAWGQSAPPPTTWG